MKMRWDAIIDDVHTYLAANIALLPHVNEQFLKALERREQIHKDVCLVPFARLQLYHIRLEQKVRQRIERKRAA